MDWYSALLVLYVVVVGILALHGVHRYQLVYLYYKHRKNTPSLTACFRDLPRVTIQLPMFNERYVARRIIEKTCQIRYPRDRLEIQVLDDSTDDTVQIASEAVEAMRKAGHNISYIHRANRTGFKAGALDNGLRHATGEFILIFDSDFIPPQDILNEQIHHFFDPRIGMVQARWEHLNRDHSLLTKTQAIMLDGHFVIEHAARNRSGRFMSFNGTAGVWRRACIDDAGGWQHDTLTEDLDLSYRAQMKGWKFVFLSDLVSPAELPPEMIAFKAQQARWAKGGAQTARKLLPRIMKSRLPWKIKAEALFHLTSCTSYVWMVVLTLLMFPVLYFKMSLGDTVTARVMFDTSLLLLATCSAGTFYVASQREIFKTWADSLKYTPLLMCVGIGVSLNNAIAALEGFFGKQSEFVRTPKFGATDSQSDPQWRKKARAERRKGRHWQPFAELFLAFYLLACVVVCYWNGRITIGIPFLLLFMAGYFYVSLLSLYGIYFAGQKSDAAALAPARQSAS